MALSVTTACKNTVQPSLIYLFLVYTSWAVSIFVLLLCILRMFRKLFITASGLIVNMSMSISGDNSQYQERLIYRYQETMEVANWEIFFLVFNL